MTPMHEILRLARSLRCDLGVMISASHNPFADNGIKLFGPDGYKLSDELELQIEDLLEKDIYGQLASAHDIGRAINESKLNLNPLVEGRSIRLPIPALTEERRKDLVKLVKSQAEEARVRVRGARKAAMDSAKKLKAENIVTEDGQRDLETQIQKLTDKYVKEIDELVAVKEKDIMTI